MAYSIPYEYFEEGKQAEEYIKRKSRAIADAEQRELERYKLKKGTVDNRPKIVNAYGDIYNSDNDNSYDRNPKYKSAKEFESYRDRYGNAMPKRKSKNELDLEKEREKNKREKDYAEDVVAKAIDRKPVNNYKDVNNYNRAYDAAKRHYRRTHKNESYGIFESVMFLGESYEDEDYE